MSISDYLGFRKTPRTLPSGCLLNYNRLNQIFQSSSKKYHEAEPFPHIVIDNFLDEDIAELVVKNFPKLDTNTWLAQDAKSRTGKVAQKLKWEFWLGSKHLDYELSLHPVIRYLLLEINSNTFLRGLRYLTGTPLLISDPRMSGGGLHQTKRGGMLRVHADFLKHPAYQFDRQINLLLFLNPRWEKEWNGELELWSQDMKEKVLSVEPIANRCVIFSTSMNSYHGYSEPLACPESITRRSIAMYYYNIPEVSGDKKITETYWQDLPDET